MLRDLQSSSAQVGAQASGSSPGGRPSVATLLAVEGLPTLNEIKKREAGWIVVPRMPFDLPKAITSLANGLRSSWLAIKCTTCSRTKPERC